MMYNPFIDGLPEGFKDCLHTSTGIHFDWKDRLRILFGAKVALKCRTYCENIPGKVYSESEVNVGFPRRVKPDCGMVEAKVEAQP